MSQRASDRILWEDTLGWARASGDTDLADRLTEIGPPPCERILDDETSNSHEQSVYAYEHSPNSEGEAQMSENILADEYTLVDEFHILGAFLDTFAALYPQLQDIDFRRTATEFEVPMFFAQAAYEADARAALFDEWYPMIEAPMKAREVFETLGVDAASCRSVSSHDQHSGRHAGGLPGPISVRMARATRGLGVGTAPAGDAAGVSCSCCLERSAAQRHEPAAERLPATATTSRLHARRSAASRAWPLGSAARAAARRASPAAAASACS